MHRQCRNRGDGVTSLYANASMTTQLKNIKDNGFDFTAEFYRTFVLHLPVRALNCNYSEVLFHKSCTLLLKITDCQ